jgi:hypothetical protein
MIFGPYGIGWGMDLITSEYRDGHIIDDMGNREVIHVELWKLWYMMDGQRGEVLHYGQTTFVGKNKYGVFTDEEAPKKTKTDAMTKCLALIGFSADIHEGMYDDIKYVNDRRRDEDAANKQPEPDRRQNGANPELDPAPTRDRIKAAIAKAVSMDALNKLWNHPKTGKAFGTLPPPMQAELTAAYAHKAADLSASQSRHVPDDDDGFEYQ